MILMLGGIEMHIGHGRALFGQAGQLEVVGRKQRKSFYGAGQLYGGSPGQAETVKRASAASHFVHQYQAVRASIVQDIGGFGHFDHERRAASR